MEKVTGEMVKPEEIKKALEIHNRGECSKCAFAKTPTGCTVKLTRCAIAYIEQLEQGHRDMKARVEYLTETLGRYVPQTPLPEEKIYNDPVWMEMKEGDFEPRVVDIVPAFDAPGIKAEIAFIGLQRRAYLLYESYGKTWRCWRHKPTDKERRDAEWLQ